MRRALLAVLLVAALTACRPHVGEPFHGASCTPPAGGRCAADVAWPGSIALSPDGRRLHGIVLCGGTLTAEESASTVTVRLHLGAIGAGGMTCARVDVGVRLSEPLGDRTVVDAISGKVIRVDRYRPTLAAPAP